MADQQDGGRLPSANSTPQNADANTNSNSVNSSNYPAYLAWSQYWQYYYTYNFYYYSSYYYNLLCQQGQPTVYGNVRNSDGQNAARWAQTLQGNRRVLNGAAIGVINVQQTGERRETRYEYTIAPLRKRVFAEFIDFVFLFFLKYILYSFYFKNTDQLSQIEYILVLDEATSLKEIEDVLFQALIYRFIVFIYETFFLAVPIFCSFGGATPGKYMMGITVISYPGLTAVLQRQHVHQYLGTGPRRINLVNACVRSFLKNFMITFFFPIMLSAMFVRDFRTPYDLIAASMVVNARPRRYTET